MPSQIHAVVENATYFNGAPADHPIKQQVAPASSMPSHVERINAGQDVIAFSEPWYVGPTDKLSNGR